MNWYKMAKSNNDWDRTWMILRRELKRDPSVGEVQKRMMKIFQNPILDLPDKPKETLFD